MKNTGRRERIELKYEEYAKSFSRNSTDYLSRINLLYDHIERVVIESRGICTSLDLSRPITEDIITAARLFLLSRYPAIHRNEPVFRPLSLDDIEHSISIIQEHDMLRDYLPSEQQYFFTLLRSLICTGKEGEESTECIIHDALRIDYLRIANDSSFHELPGNIFSLPKVSSLQKAQLSKESETFLTILAGISSLHYLWSYMTVKRRNYLDTIAGKIPGAPPFVNSFIEDHRRILEKNAQKARSYKIKGV
ncbi:MAG: hypothetical protein ACQEQV_01810 [Fibrobacterota bacterium]